MRAVDYAKSQIGQVFDLLNICAEGVDEKQYNFNPGGTCNSVAKSHVHAISGIDFFVIRMLKGGDMLWPEFGPANGLPANPQEIWGHAGAVPLAAMKDFAAKAEKVALDYVASLSDADLDREVETQFFGKKTAGWVLQLLAMHTAGHAGDMATVKGMQGLKGLPF